jgi:hypothetical protein
MVPTPEVLAAAAHVYASYRESALWAPALTDAQLLTPDLSVEPLLDGGTEYFLFEMRRGAATTARMAIDISGKLLEAEGVKTTTGSLLPFVDAASARWWALGRTLRVVWRPCIQSTTRLRPFWEVSGPQGTRYLRVDGVVFDKLTIKIGIG